MSYDAIVVGGGIAGCACALRLAERGQKVLLVERGDLASGASGRNQGGLLPSPEPSLGRLFTEGVEFYRTVTGEATVDIGLRRRGYLLVAADETGLATARGHGKALAEGGFEIEQLDSDALLALEPHLAGDLPGAVAVHGAHSLHPVLATVALAELARRHGAQLRTHTTVRGLHRTAGRVTGVITDHGVISAAAVVVATGPWTRSLTLQAGVDVPVFGARGWLVRTTPLRGLAFKHTMMQSTWHGNAGLASNRLPTLDDLAGDAAAGLRVVFSLQPLPSGEVVLGSSMSNASRDDPQSPGAARLIAQAAVRFAPGLRQAPFRSAWSGIRPSTPDGLPVFGPAPAVEGLWIASGYGIDGMPLAPATARMLAVHITEGRPEPAALPFDPARFG